MNDTIPVNQTTLLKHITLPRPATETDSFNTVPLWAVVVTDHLNLPYNEVSLRVHKHTLVCSESTVQYVVHAWVTESGV